MRSFNKLALLALVVVLAGCASVAKIDSGDRVVGDRLTVNLEGAWNQVSAPGIAGPNCYVWTMEGLPIDQLLIYSGVRNDQAIQAESGGTDAQKKVYKFRSTMQPEQIVALFEGMLTRDGSTFKLTRLAPAAFGGDKGFKFDYSLTRKTDNVQLLGTGGAVVSKGELFAIVYQAPRLVFYPRQKARVAHIIGSAKLSGV
jgi:hypothetical protein